MSDTEDATARDLRRTRNQDLFRQINENLRELNEDFAELTGTFTITCECADTNCTKQFDLTPVEYAAVRADSTHFAVLSGHIYPEIERIVARNSHYVVVEKFQQIADAAGITKPAG